MEEEEEIVAVFCEDGLFIAPADVTEMSGLFTLYS